MKLTLVVGTRPNMIKVAPLIWQLKERNDKNVKFDLVHTGQHYHDKMSRIFLKDLDIQEPDFNFEVGSKSHAYQTAEIMRKFENYCIKEKPDIVVVLGDVNSTLACALVVAKMKDIKLAHVEAGNRLYDKTSEEVNRVLTDTISDYLFCLTETDRKYLISESKASTQCYVVGNIMIDTLIHKLPKIEVQMQKDHALLTLHRAENVDDPNRLKKILEAIGKVAENINIIFPIHPRTLNRIKLFGYKKYLRPLSVCSPVGYLKFIGLLKNAKFLITDSGGLQVDSSFLDVPCFTLLSATGHFESLIDGTNTLIGIDKDKLLREVDAILSGRRSHTSIKSKYWDGKVAERILNVLLN